MGWDFGGGINVGGVSLGSSGYGPVGDLAAAGNTISNSGSGGAQKGSSSWTNIIPGIGDANAATLQNKMNIEAAERAMQFSERMSSTAYQRAMDDMKKAGLNPMLTMSQGGASAPSGVVPSINSTTQSKFGETALAAFTGVNSTATARQQADTQQSIGESSIQLNRASAAKQVADAEQTRVETIKSKKDIPRAELEAKMSKRATNAIEKLINGVTTSGKERSRVGDVLNTFGKGVNFLFGPKQKQGPSPVQPKGKSSNGNF